MTNDGLELSGRWKTAARSVAHPVRAAGRNGATSTRPACHQRHAPQQLGCGVERGLLFGADRPSDGGVDGLQPVAQSLERRVVLYRVGPWITASASGGEQTAALASAFRVAADPLGLRSQEPS